MNVIILNGNSDPSNEAFDTHLLRVKAQLEQGQHQVTVFNLREMDLRYCTGCFGCWVKTPGECISQDDGAQIRSAVINADFLLWASPLCMGFPNALLKKMTDKLIPLIHPYFAVDQGEAHHRARYDNYPRVGLVLQKEEDTDGRDVEIVTGIFGRTALNIKSRLEFVRFINNPVEELVAAIEMEPAPIRNKPEGLKATQGVSIAPPRKITVFNGSPRGQKGNTPLLMGEFIKGFTAIPGNSVEVFHLNKVNDLAQHIQAFQEAECVILGFPLYTDAMPGLVKAFIDGLKPFRGKTNNPPMGFFVHSGFPEAAHSRHVEQYLQKLVERLGSPYLGTIVKGGSEGIQIMPPNMTNSLFAQFEAIGRGFAENGRFDPVLLKKIAGTERFPAILSPLFKLFVRLPVASFYWDMQLKKNGVFEQRFKRPYEKKPVNGR